MSAATFHIPETKRRTYHSKGFTTYTTYAQIQEADPADHNSAIVGELYWPNLTIPLEHHEYQPALVIGQAIYRYSVNETHVFNYNITHLNPSLHRVHVSFDTDYDPFRTIDLTEMPQEVADLTPTARRSDGDVR